MSPNIYSNEFVSGFPVDWRDSARQGFSLYCMVPWLYTFKAFAYTSSQLTPTTVVLSMSHLHVSLNSKLNSNCMWIWIYCIIFLQVAACHFGFVVKNATLYFLQDDTLKSHLLVITHSKIKWCFLLAIKPLMALRPGVWLADCFCC